MKKIKIVGLVLAVGCVGLIGMTGCTSESVPYDLTIANAQKEFSIGDDFVLGEDFKVTLQFNGNKTMILDNKNAIKFENKKVIQATDYIVDYSNFNSSTAGRYYIFVTFNDHDNDSTNNIKRSYQVTVVEPN